MSILLTGLARARALPLQFRAAPRAVHDLEVGLASVMHNDPVSSGLLTEMN